MLVAGVAVGQGVRPVAVLAAVVEDFHDAALRPVMTRLARQRRVASRQQVRQMRLPALLMASYSRPHGQRSLAALTAEKDVPRKMLTCPVTGSRWAMLAQCR